MVIRNLQRYLLNLQLPPESLLAVDLVLSGSDVVSMPQPTDFYKLIVQVSGLR